MVLWLVDDFLLPSYLILQKGSVWSPSAYTPQFGKINVNSNQVLHLTFLVLFGYHLNNFRSSPFVSLLEMEMFPPPILTAPQFNQQSLFGDNFGSHKNFQQLAQCVMMV